MSDRVGNPEDRFSHNEAQVNMSNPGKVAQIQKLDILRLETEELNQ